MGIFHADMAAVGLLERRDDVAQLHLAATAVGHEVEGRIEVLLAQSESLQRELIKLRRRLAERVDVGLEMPNRAVGKDQIACKGLLAAVNDGRLMRLSCKEIGDRCAVVAQRETLEKRTPRRVNPVGVVEPLAIHRLNDIDVGADRY